ncbi:hypothetical protein [Streptomyces sp. W1SF4]|uniref:hypothetical protein n=1 Tax=Streptomyces sp. W1SF4 TaxID=2305220 RepID=UPI000F714CC7|nr:hypothetical protein [Streptomyces sp. W1SF4]AZM92214.1 hypothetical protein D1J60_30210 [Streptomyces sp. W1SF4]
MAQRKGCLIGCGIALVLGAGLLVALFFGAAKVLDIADKTLLDPKVYEAVKVGDAESEVRAKLPSGDTFVKDALKEGGPAEPAGSVCAWYLSAADGQTEDVFRLCFKDGKLAEKAQYRMK